MMAANDIHALEAVFVPGADNHRAFRNALGSFTTGVTVVTAMTSDGPIGMTVNSFASVSLDPPLVLWSPAKSSSRYGAFTGARHFAIHVLGADQDHLVQRVAARQELDRDVVDRKDQRATDGEQDAGQGLGACHAGR